MIPQIAGYRVLVKPDSLEEYDKVVASAKKAGLLLAEVEERKELTAVDTGTVVQIGPVAFSDRGGADNWCKVGDKICYARHGGKLIKNPTNETEKYLILNDEDVLLVWKE